MPTHTSSFISSAVSELDGIEKAVAEHWPESTRHFDRVRLVANLVCSRRLMRDLEDIETAIYHTQGEP
jgi:hypothetical protein